MSRRTAAALVAAAVWTGGGVGPHADATAQYSRDWRRLRSDHFTAAGNAAYPAMRTVLLELEGFRRALLRTFPSTRQAPSIPTTVVVFRDDRSFEPFKPKDRRGERRDTVAGYFLSGPRANYMAVAMHRDPTRTFQYLFHEYTHYLVRAQIGSPPHWLNEGLAEFYSTVQARPRERRSVVGLPPINRLARLRLGQLLPLGDIFTFTSGETLDGPQERSAAFYAQSWALVHYLLLGEEGRHRSSLAVFVNARPGVPVESVVQSALGMSLDELERHVARYARRDSFPQVGIEDPEGGLQVRTTQEVMLEADVEALQRELLEMLNRSAQ